MNRLQESMDPNNNYSTPPNSQQRANLFGPFGAPVASSSTNPPQTPESPITQLGPLDAGLAVGDRANVEGSQASVQSGQRSQHDAETSPIDGAQADQARRFSPVRSPRSSSQGAAIPSLHSSQMGEQLSSHRNNLMVRLADLNEELATATSDSDIQRLNQLLDSTYAQLVKIEDMHLRRLQVEAQIACEAAAVQMAAQAPAQPFQTPPFQTPPHSNAPHVPKPLTPHNLPKFRGSSEHAMQDSEDFIKAFVNEMGNCNMPQEKWAGWLRNCLADPVHVLWFDSLTDRSWPVVVEAFHDQVDSVMLHLQNWRNLRSAAQTSGESIDAYTVRFKALVVRVFGTFDADDTHIAFAYYDGFLPYVRTKVDNSIFLDLRTHHAKINKRDLVRQVLRFDNIHAAALFASATMKGNQGNPQAQPQTKAQPDKKAQAAKPAQSTEKKHDGCTFHGKVSHTDEQCFSSNNPNKGKKRSDITPADAAKAAEAFKNNPPPSRSAAPATAATPKNTFHPRKEVNALEASAAPVVSAMQVDSDDGDDPFDDDTQDFASFNAVEEATEPVLRRAVGRLITTPCTINGVMVAALVDCGANVSIISESFVKAHNIPMIEAAGGMPIISELSGLPAQQREYVVKVELANGTRTIEVVLEVAQLRTRALVLGTDLFGQLGYA